MDQQQLQQKIAEYFAKLPTDAQTMFASMEWMKTLENLSAKYNMTALQIQSLGTETTLLLLGIVHPDEYMNFLQTDLSLSKSVQDRLMADINLGILNKWRETLTSVYNQNTIEIANNEYGGEKKLNEIFTNLPKEVQNAIANSNYQKELYIIASEQKLSIDQMGKLEKVTNKILLGLEHPDKYDSMLETELGLSKDKAIELGSAVNERVLKNIRGLLKGHAEMHIEPELPVPPYSQAKQAEPTFTPTPVVQAIPMAQSTPFQAPVTQETITPIYTAPKPIVNMPEVKNTFASMQIPTVAPTEKIEMPQAYEPEKKIFNDSGIEMMKEAPVVPNTPAPATESVSIKEDTLMRKDGVSIMEDKMDIPTPPIESNINMERDTLYGIENPSTTKVGMLQNKLSNPTVSIQSATDQSMPKMGGNDPYREKIG